MCLIVIKSYVQNPIPAMICYKVLLKTNKNTYKTPYQSKLISKNGLLIPSNPSKRYKKEFKREAEINGGFIHAYTVKPSLTFREGLRCNIFKAIALNVIATGNNDLVCQKLYIPDLDLTRK